VRVPASLQTPPPTWQANSFPSASSPSRERFPRRRASPRRSRSARLSKNKRILPAQTT